VDAKFCAAAEVFFFLLSLLGTLPKGIFPAAGNGYRGQPKLHIQKH